jgi:Cu-Zn family superoxide dismutase
MNKQTFSSAAMALILLGATCGIMAGAAEERKAATAEIKDGKGQNAGQAKFTATKGGVEMSVTVTNLSPGVHAIHIHEAGKCDAPGFTTAGGHFNPATVGANGKGTFKSTIQNVTLAGDGATSLFHPGGTSVVVHEKEDDMKTDPAGNAGARIACGVIQ